MNPRASLARIRLGGALLALTGVGVAVGWTQLDTPPRADAQTSAAQARAPAPVTLETMEPSEVRRAHVYHGVVQPRRRALVSFVEGGRLEARPAEVGDAVRAGDVLATLDRRGHRNAVRAARADLEELGLRRAQLGRDRDRSERLREDGVTTVAQLEQARTGHARVEAMQAAARANLAESRRRSAEAVLRAPFDGVVTDVMVEPGELVAAGQPILRLAGAAGHEVVLQVHAELARTLAPGAELALSATGLEAEDPLARRPLRGTVGAVVAEAASLQGLFPVRVDLAPDPALRAGLGVEATLRGPPRQALRVPLGAVLDPSGRRPFVWRAVDGRAERAWIRVGRLEGARVEVLEGLSPGDRVVVRGHVRLLPGDPVEGARP